MTMQAKIVSFAILSTDTGTKQVRGVGFTPQVILSLMCGRGESSDTAGRATINRGIGMGITGPSDQGLASHSTDAVGTSVCNVCDSPSLITVSGAGVEDGAADLSSIVSDGFDINITNAFPSDIQVVVLCLGGDSITNLAIGRLAATAATGAYTGASGLGFTPTFALFASNGRNSNGNLAHSRFSIGAATGSSNQIIAASSARNAQTTDISMSYALDSGTQAECAAMIDVDSLSDAVGLSSFGSGTINMNCTVFSFAMAPLYLALAGGNYAVGSFLTQTDTNDIPVTGVGFRPAAVLLISCNRAESSADTTTAVDQFSIGAFTSSESMALSTRENDATAGAQCSTAIDFDKCYINLDSAGAVQGLMAWVAMGSDGFTVKMATADNAANWVGYIAFGPGTAPAGTTGNLAWIAAA